MKKRIPIAIFLLTLSLTLTACTTKDGKSAREVIKSDDDRVSRVEEGEEGLKGNIYDLLKLNRDIKCTFKSESEDGTTLGVTYVTGGKTKTEVEIKNDDMNIKSYSILDGDWIYTWTSESNQGTKTNLKEMEGVIDEDTDDNTAESSDYYNQYHEFDYKCTSWSPDESLFDLPENIEFVDLSEMVE